MNYTILFSLVLLVPVQSFSVVKAPRHLFFSRRTGSTTNLERLGSTRWASKVPSGSDVELVQEQNDAIEHLYKTQDQLWLDLRDTAVFPHEAIQFLKEQLEDDSLGSLIDGVLVNTDMFQRLIERQRRLDCTLLYQADDMLVLNDGPSQMSIPVGNFILCDKEQHGGNLDVLTVIDIVAQERKWIFLDQPETTSTSETKKWMLDQVSSLFQLLAASSSGSSLASSSDIFLATQDDETSAVNKQSAGGIAIICKDQSSFLQMDAAVAEFRNCASLHSTITTDSGLVVPVEDGSDMFGSESVLPRIALVLPLDLHLWKAALDVRHIEDERQAHSDSDLQPYDTF